MGTWWFRWLWVSGVGFVVLVPVSYWFLCSWRFAVGAASALLSRFAQCEKAGSPVEAYREFLASEAVEDFAYQVSRDGVLLGAAFVVSSSVESVTVRFDVVLGKGCAFVDGMEGPFEFSSWALGDAVRGEYEVLLMPF